MKVVRYNQNFSNTCSLHVCFICNYCLHVVHDLSPWSPGGGGAAVSWVISITVGLSVDLWALLVVLWESQLQLRFLWCGRSWSWDSIERSRCYPYGMFLRHECTRCSVKCTEHHILTICKTHLLVSLEPKRCQRDKLLCLSLVSCSSPLVTPIFSLRRTQQDPNRLIPLLHFPSSVLVAGRKVAHIPAVTVSRTGATRPDGPWTF